MTIAVASILSDKRRNWRREQPLSLQALNRFKHTIDVELPAEYAQLLRYANGGEGDLALPPRWFVLFDVDRVQALYQDDFYRKQFPGLFFFGGNGGLEMIAFDTRRPSPWPIVAVDPIAGMRSAMVIAPDLLRFIEAVGLPYEVDPR